MFYFVYVTAAYNVKPEALNIESNAQEWDSQTS